MISIGQNPFDLCELIETRVLGLSLFGYECSAVRVG